VDCTYYIVDREFGDDEPLPIGIPCRNSDVMLLSEDNQKITKPNETGEICVRGSSLAMGYYGNPEKTAEVFVQNPLNDRYRELIYKTGDLGYYNEYNEIMFVGRKDFQIKHMGYRIELGEIENAALKIDSIGNVCVLYDTKNKEIVLCYELKSDVDEKDIRKQLMGIIPKYMVPTKYYKLKKFPYNDNGKIDRKKLQEEYL
jgi:acyl-CoA synthetase (AMP-forming)/AMP-acid ligase II